MFFSCPKCNNEFACIIASSLIDSDALNISDLSYEAIASINKLLRDYPCDECNCLFEIDLLEKKTIVRIAKYDFVKTINEDEFTEYSEDGFYEDD